MKTDIRLIGKLIHELRKQQNMTGQELGRQAAMSQSKISKLENGTYPRIELKEIERILNILHAPDQARRRIYAAMDRSRAGAVRYEPYHDVRYAKDNYERNLKTNHFRVFSPFIVPALLQTNEYRLALLKSWDTPEDDLDIIQTLVKRQELLWDKHRSFHFIMHQATLYSSPPGHKGIDPAQMDRIERFIGLPNIQIGIIPLEAGMPLVETGPFALLDERFVATATINGDIVSTDSRSIDLYSRLFADLDQLALYNEPAKELIRKVDVRFN